MSLLPQRLEAVRTHIVQAAQSCGRAPEEVTLVAATKTQSMIPFGKPLPPGFPFAGKTGSRNLLHT